MQAPAKINLYLNITGKRPDNYHTIQTIFYPIHNLYDQITITHTPQPNITITCNNPTIPTNKKNLCWQAANAFSKTTQTKPHWHIDLQKNIPIAAGLGGGSSDAATVLKILNNHHKQPLTPSQLNKLATTIGADVPFFLNPTPAIATSIGEQITPIPTNINLPIILINPLFPITAAWAYQHTSKKHWQNNTHTPQQQIQALKQNNINNIAKTTYNILQPTIIKKFPITKIIIQTLLQNRCLSANISGSGPTIFAICPNEQQQQVKKILQKKIPQTFWSYFSSDFP